MSDTDSFIDEVNEEVRRDQLYAMMRRYGWIAALAVILLVGGAAWQEYRKAKTRAAAEAVGDSLLVALSTDDSEARVKALQAADVPAGTAGAVQRMLLAGEMQLIDDTAGAIEQLDIVSASGDTPEIYRQIARFKSLTLQDGQDNVADRRLAFEAMAQPGNAMRLLASEQLALLDIEAGDVDAGLERYQAILSDAEAWPDLQRRAMQVMVALGATPEVLAGQTPVTIAPGADEPAIQE